MTWLYLSLFLSMSSDDYATRNVCFQALKGLPEARRTLAAFPTNDVELIQRRKVLEAHWRNIWLPTCPRCQAGFQSSLLEIGLVPFHGSYYAGGRWAPCSGESKLPVYVRIR